MRTRDNLFLLALALVVAFTLVAAAATRASAQDGLPTTCHARADILYACMNGYRPAGRPASFPPICTSRADYYYACQNGWRP